MNRPYADAAELYWGTGWRGVLPLPPRRKADPPKGHTGHDGLEPSYADVCAWAEDRPDSNIGLRLPDGVIGIDVDAYEGKVGGTTYERWCTEHGPLPPTWRSTSRDDGLSSIRLYRVPTGRLWQTKLTGGGVEVIQHAHRYAVVWPSVHPEGRTYRWLDPEGVPSARPPSLDDLPVLPQAWQDALTSPGLSSAGAERAVSVN